MISRTEGLGKLLNYMAMGLPTVAFDVPVAREYLGDLGLYAETGNAAIASAGCSDSDGLRELRHAPVDGWQPA